MTVSNYPTFKADGTIYCVKTSAIYYANERRGMKKMTTSNSADEICFQIDNSLQTVDVNYEIGSLSKDRASSLASSLRHYYLIHFN